MNNTNSKKTVRATANTNNKKATRAPATNAKSKKTVARTNPNAGKVIRVVNGKRKYVAKRTNPTNQRERESFNYQSTKVGAIKFGTASAAALYMLQRTKLSQSEIARRCGVSQPCVCQLAATVKRG